MKKKISFRKLSLMTIMCIMTVVLFTGCLDNKSKKYATDYPLDVKKTKNNVLGKWDIWKREENGVVFLQIDCGYSDREEERDYMLFWVFDTPSQAKDMYEEYYESSKKYDNGRYWEEGDNWFVSEEPGVCDATIVWMNCLSDNVIISTELDIWSSWSENVTNEEPETTEETEVAEERFDTSKLKDYVIDNASKLEDYVLNEILK